MPEPTNNGPRFEDNIKQIDHLIMLNVSKWKLKAIPSMDKDDIAQILRLHIYTKWELYDPKRPLGNWISTVISRKIKNILRDEYYKFAPPCLSCPAYLGKTTNGEGECKLFGICGNACKLYEKWQQDKKHQYDICLPVTSEDHGNEINSRPFHEINFDDQMELLKSKLQEKLSLNDYKIFIGLYIENKTENQISQELGYKTSKNNEINRQINNVKTNIVKLVRQILADNN